MKIPPLVCVYIFFTESRMTSCVPIRVFRELVQQLLFCFLLMRLMMESTAAVPNAPFGTLMVVSDGRVSDAFGLSLKPIREMSSGIL